MKTRQAYHLTNIVINLLAAGATLSLALLAPGAVRALKGPLKALRHFTRHQLYQALYRLKRKKLVEIIEKKGDQNWRLTSRGHKVASQLSVWFTVPKALPHWDQRWRLVVFDVPEKRKHARDVLRGRLKLWGFHQLQKSVWIWPYPCQGEIEKLAADLEISPYVHVAEVDYLSRYQALLKRFDLV